MQSRERTTQKGGNRDSALAMGIEGLTIGRGIGERLVISPLTVKKAYDEFKREGVIRA